MTQYTLPEKLSVSPSPHVRTLDTVRSVMLDVIIALLPAAVWGIYRFGARALLILLISVGCAVAAEAVFQIIVKKPMTAGDLTAAVSGLILGLSMPSGVSLWVPALGSVFAVIVVKQLFGGTGHNIVNPAICARVFLMLCFPTEMTKYVDVKTDLITSATPLVSLKAGIVPQTSLFNAVLGNMTGAIGEVSAIALGAGFVYLLVRGVVKWEIPVAFVGVVFIYTLAFPITGDNPTSMAYEMVSGSLLFCALIAANDWTTTPVTSGGRLLFGIGCGVITVVIRYYGSYPDGSSFAIIIMNLMTPLFESFTAPRRFGAKNGKGGAIL